VLVNTHIILINLAALGIVIVNMRWVAYAGMKMHKQHIYF